MHRVKKKFQKGAKDKLRSCKETDVHHLIKAVIVHIKTQPGHLLIIISDNPEHPTKPTSEAILHLSLSFIFTAYGPSVVNMLWAPWTFNYEHIINVADKAEARARCSRDGEGCCGNYLDLQYFPTLINCIASCATDNTFEGEGRTEPKISNKKKSNRLAH